MYAYFLQSSNTQNVLSQSPLENVQSENLAEDKTVVEWDYVFCKGGDITIVYTGFSLVFYPLTALLIFITSFTLSSTVRHSFLSFEFQNFSK